MRTKRPASNAHRLVLTATPRLNKPTPKESFFTNLRDKDAAAVKKDAKTVTPETGPHQQVSSNSSTSIKDINSFSKQETKPASTPTAAAGATVESNIATASVIKNLNNDKEYKYTARHLECDLFHLPPFTGLAGFTAREVLKRFNHSIPETFPHLSKAINEWYDIVGLPKEPLHPWKGYLGVPEFGLPGKMAESLSRHVGTRYLEWMNRV
ncbi:hypothetical protein HDU77_008926 [Chytriomyces hyalinus]|nr:hypothetical protein HDU77_008926 [Chytriomyces hyalinus]